MSRTNPYKKKRRSAKKTILIFGEGLGEEMFLKHLRRIYSRDSGTQIKIQKGKGGTSDRVVIDADKTPGYFDKKIVIIDNDKAKSEMERARREAKNRAVSLLENTPCLEFILLSILENEQKLREKKSNWYKKEFEAKYIIKKKRGDSIEYEKLFSKFLLEERRLKISDLNRLISIMEDKFHN